MTFFVPQRLETRVILIFVCLRHVQWSFTFFMFWHSVKTIQEHFRRSTAWFIYTGFRKSCRWVRDFSIPFDTTNRLLLAWVCLCIYSVPGRCLSRVPGIFQSGSRMQLRSTPPVAAYQELYQSLSMLLYECTMILRRPVYKASSTLPLKDCIYHWSNAAFCVMVPFVSHEFQRRFVYGTKLVCHQSPHCGLYAREISSLIFV